MKVYPSAIAARIYSYQLIKYKARAIITGLIKCLFPLQRISTKYQLKVFIIHGGKPWPLPNAPLFAYVARPLNVMSSSQRTLCRQHNAMGSLHGGTYSYRVFLGRVWDSFFFWSPERGRGASVCSFLYWQMTTLRKKPSLVTGDNCH